LGHGAEYLPHQLGGGGGVGKVGRRVHRHELDATIAQQGVACELHGEVTREPAGILDQDDANAMVFAVTQHGRKTWAASHWIGTGDSWVIECLDEVMPSLCMHLDRVGLSALTILVGADI